MVLKRETLPIKAESDIVVVRQVVRRYAIEAKFSVVEQTKLITAASELARNTLIYGNGGEAHLEFLQDDRNKLGVGITFEDHGPGIADVEQALTDGYTTGGGLGLGLSGSKRLVSEFEIDTVPGQGTKVRVKHWRKH